MSEQLPGFTLHLNDAEFMHVVSCVETDRIRTRKAIIKGLAVEDDMRTSKETLNKSHFQPLSIFVYPEALIFWAHPAFLPPFRGDFPHFPFSRRNLAICRQ